MTARQQLARLLPVVLLAALAIAGLRGTATAPRFDGPLRGEGVAVGIGLEIVLGALLVITLRRDGAERRAAAARPYHEADDDIAVPAALRFALRWVLSAGMIAIAVVLVGNLHLHFFVPNRPLRLPGSGVRPRPRPTLGPGHVSSYHVPVAPILYGLLVVALVAAVAMSLWWAARLRGPAPPLPAAAGELDAEDLREAVESGRAALGELDDARAAIIACYLAMERSLADRGAARGVADTPDELLARAVSAGVVRGAAARRLTALFYEARFSSHPLGGVQRDAASAALDELAAELEAGAPGAEAAP